MGTAAHARASPREASTLKREPFSRLVLLFEQLVRQIGFERLEKLFLSFQLLRPLVRLDRQQLAHACPRNALESVEIEILRSRDATDWTLPGSTPAFTAIDDPFQDSHVVPKAGPEKFPGGVFAEPINMKNERRPRWPRPVLEPVPEIVADVVAAERQHGHRIAPHLADRAGRGGGGVGGHPGGPEKTRASNNCVGRHKQ